MDNLVEHIKELEKSFSNNQYNGSGKTPFFIRKGSIPIIISCPHAINQYREGKMKWADRYTGSIGLFLHEVTGCHLICSSKFNNTDPNYDPIDKNEYQKTLRKYIEKNEIKFLIDLHGAAENRGCAIEMGTAPGKNLKKGISRKTDTLINQFEFVVGIMKNLFEEKFRICNTEKKIVWENITFTAGKQNTITKYITENTAAVGVQLEINAYYRNPKNEKEFSLLVEGLVDLVKILSWIDWEQIAK